MPRGSLSPFLALVLPPLLAACGQSPGSGAADPYANGASFPWSFTAPTGALAPQYLTPGDNTLSYEPLLAARNSWGPIEVNKSNGERLAGDGKTLTLNGKAYAKGYGTHAGSELRFSLGGTNNATCTRFTADIGVDDEVGSRGSVVFQVYLDGVKAYDSGVMTGASATRRVDVDVTDRRELRLVVTDAGNGISYDHADWANPKIACTTGYDTPYYVSADPETVYAPVDAVVTVGINVVSETDATGPVSFTLSNFGPGGEIELVEPNRVYRAATLPAHFEVKLRLNVPPGDPEFPLPPGSSTRLLTHYEGYEYPDYSRRFLFTWVITP